MSEQDEKEREKPTKLQHYAKVYRQVRITGTKGRTHQMATQCQMLAMKTYIQTL